jgi:hypothetical protein
MTSAVCRHEAGDAESSRWWTTLQGSGREWGRRSDALRCRQVVRPLQFPPRTHRKGAPGFLPSKREFSLFARSSSAVGNFEINARVRPLVAGQAFRDGRVIEDEDGTGSVMCGLRRQWDVHGHDRTTGVDHSRDETNVAHDLVATYGGRSRVLELPLTCGAWAGARSRVRSQRRRACLRPMVRAWRSVGGLSVESTSTSC